MRRMPIAFAVLSLLLLPGFASADTTLVSAALPATSGVISLQPFNANHGTLDSVEVTITGTITALVATQLNIEPVSGATIPVPFSVSADQSFQGLPPGSFFTWFAQDSTFTFNGVGSGAGEVVPMTNTFLYTFHFDGNTDLSGLTAISSTGPTIGPGIAEGTLAGFTSTYSPVMLEQMTMMPGAIPSIGGQLLNTTVAGSILVEYDYTPDQTPPPTPASEPGTLMLLGSGLAGLAAWLSKK